MYQPKKYIKDDPEFIFQFIQNHPFATMVSNSHPLVATHIPVLVEGTAEDFRLYAHIANHNEQLESLENDAEVLFIFQGSHAYVSSSWYAEKDISTWNYSAVHINAKIKIQTSKELENSLEKLVKTFENQQKSPLFYNDIPKQMLQDHLPLITGFWAIPFKIKGIAKLHQSYSKEDIISSVEHLEKGTLTDKQLAKDLKEENGLP
ncbi:FMN-binding negative transcriptional regulator [Zunongwangia endophytica]|uniref:FMN-binding negative transcriptional regulator n=1 Tax=Zunongwangia endophytica TaxID=1808945 RepID=A0ABV8H8E5_9FLAO|nr:FMN-binding negative transcriptional regulator [Zunongwangia endophytica]MDN3595466.1 FMN-binding negative transcriptional regulator [Zunongwangia endophytica]